MKIFTYSVARTSSMEGLRYMYTSLGKSMSPGLVHAEFMAGMELGSPVFSRKRLLLHQLVMFASWENEESIEQFLEETEIGKSFVDGWHVRMEFVRRWGDVKEFSELPDSVVPLSPNEPVIAVTLASVKLPELPRFIHWGRPVEELVRDHPGTEIAMASMRLPNTVSTFSMWKSLREMLSMVHGHDEVIHEHDRHATAMKERIRRDFHHQFTTLRFKLLSEHGSREIL